MKISRIAGLVISFFLVADAQQGMERYVTGMTIFGSAKAGCPVFVGGVWKLSPAARAGIRAGDQLILVDGGVVSSLEDAAKRLAHTVPGTVAVQVSRDGKLFTVPLERENYAELLRKNGLRLTSDGNPLDMNATDAEVQQYLATQHALEQEQSWTTIFPGHYPADKSLYYPGFEIFVWDNGRRVTVGGIEDGPAKRSGVRWGDPILSVDGVDPHGKSVAKLEALFGSRKPASMTLVIDRAGVRRPFSFELEQASAVLRENQWQIVNGRMVPLWAPEKYFYCFEE